MTRVPNGTSSPTVPPADSTPPNLRSGARSSTPLPSSRPRYPSPADRPRPPPTTSHSTPPPSRSCRTRRRKLHHAGPWFVRTRPQGLLRLLFARRHRRGGNSSSNSSAGRVTVRQFVVCPCGSRRFRLDVRTRLPACLLMHFAAQTPYIEYGSPDYWVSKRGRGRGRGGGL